MLTARRAALGDLEPITEIYNEAIVHTTATFDTEPKTLDEQRSWYTGHDSKHPILVAEKEDIVVGWASLSNWSDRCAYADTAEVSLYVKKEYRKEGIGKLLLETLLQEGKKAGLHTLIARIAEGNSSSVKLFEREGFILIGVMKEVGRKFGRLLDVYLMQKIYK